MYNCTSVQTKSHTGLFLCMVCLFIKYLLVLSGVRKHRLEEGKGEQWYLPEELLTPAQLGAVAAEVHLYESKM